MDIHRSAIIRVDRCESGMPWVHLDISKLTHSSLRAVIDNSKILLKESKDNFAFCAVHDNKLKLAELFGFRLIRKTKDRAGSIVNIMKLEITNAGGK